MWYIDRHMETVSVKTTTTTQPARQAAVNGLAVVGFIALIFIGITLAIYAARYVPQTVARLGAANVYLSSIFGDAPEGDGDLEVVPGDSVPFPTNDEPEVITTEDPDTTTPTTPATPRPGTPTVIQVPVTVPVAPYGKADLIVRITDIGYLRSSNIDTFVEDDTVPEGKRPAFKFRVTNTGTNTTGSWEFKVKLPTTSTYTYVSRGQASLAPGQYVDYTLGFDRAKDGENRVTVTVDSSDDVNESNENNNTASTDIEVED